MFDDEDYPRNQPKHLPYAVHGKTDDIKSLRLDSSDMSPYERESEGTRGVPKVHCFRGIVP